MQNRWGTATSAQRSEVYAALLARNRIVALLRIGLPAIGAIIFAGLVLQLYLGTMVPDFAFATMHLDRENLVFEAPSYTGTGSDGTAYTLAAESASAGLRSTDLVELKGASLSMLTPAGLEFTAEAPVALFSVKTQMLTVSGDTAIASSTGLVGTLGDAVIDVLNERLSAPGGADLTFGNGTTLRADAMAYDGTTRSWTFAGRVKLTFSRTPGETAYREGGELTGLFQ
jgi:hypothetical protein